MKSSEKKIGRPVYGEPMVGGSVSMPQRLWDKAARIGNANISEGLRRAVEAWKNASK